MFFELGEEVEGDVIAEVCRQRERGVVEGGRVTFMHCANFTISNIVRWQQLGFFTASSLQPS